MVLLKIKVVDNNDACSPLLSSSIYIGLFGLRNQINKKPKLHRSPFLHLHSWYICNLWPHSWWVGSCTPPVNVRINILEKTLKGDGIETFRLLKAMIHTILAPVNFLCPCNRICMKYPYDLTTIGFILEMQILNLKVCPEHENCVQNLKSMPKN